MVQFNKKLIGLRNNWGSYVYVYLNQGVEQGRNSYLTFFGEVPLVEA
jgi:hypothetical protein